MNRPFWIVIFLFPIVCISCKKEHLYDEREIFIGSWNWDRSIGIPLCSTEDFDTTLASNYSTEYMLEITKKEKAYRMEAGTVTDETPILVSTFDDISSGQEKYSFTIYFDESRTDAISGTISQDSLLIYDFWPPDFTRQQCKFYQNYFVRQN